MGRDHQGGEHHGELGPGRATTAAAGVEPPGQEQFRTRTSVLFASHAPKAVVLRRGPKTHWHLLLWDLKTDAFTPGQWMKGLVVLSDLSPSGDKLIYWAAQYHDAAPWKRRLAQQPYEPLSVGPARPKRPSGKVARYMRGAAEGRPIARPMSGTWTAISTPPFFTALAIWPAFGHWTGGGVFHGENELGLNELPNEMAPIENVPIPKRMKIRSLHAPGVDRTPSARRPSAGQDLQSGELWEGLVQGGAEWVDWVHVQSPEQLLFACDGHVHRLHGWRGVPPAQWLREAKLLADLRPARFALKPAPPSAMRW
jgi:hypothetical protein